MYRKDQIKGIIAIILFGTIGLCYLLFSEEVAKIAAVVSLIVWFGSMFFLNRRKF